ncbi:MAG TPA: hypothetical protein VF791_14975 [Pyrinomonadaceae bacterium]
MNRKLSFFLVPVFALISLCLTFQESPAQTSSPFAFRPGQTIYIVAFRRVRPLTTTSEGGVVGIDGQEYSDYDLDAERKVRKRIEDWTFFRVADKPSQADFVFLVNLDQNSVEGLVIPFEAYQRYFKDKYDLDALRDAAYGRYMVGPLKLATISRLSDRLVELFRDKTGSSNKRAGK